MDNEILKNWEKCFVPDVVLKALEKENFKKPTEIQNLVLPCAIRDRLDILGAAATGTGKTLAFGIPMISRILMDRQKEIEIYEAEDDEEEGKENMDEEDDCDDEDEECDLSPSESELEFGWNDGDLNPEVFVGAESYKYKDLKCKPYEHIYGLVLTPTRELACQVSDHLKRACQFTDLKVCAIFGGMSVERQERLLNKKPEILVVTPGRFWSFIQDQDPHAMSCSKISVLVIDEADRMLEKGHFAELENIIDWMKTNSGDRMIKTLPMKPRQTLVFSATLTFVHSTNEKNVPLKKMKKLTKNDKLGKFITKLGMHHNPKIIDTTIDIAQLTQWRILCPTQEDKDTRLFWFIKHHPGRTIVFANSKNSVRRLTSVLQTLGLEPKALIADMQQKMRLKKLESFSKLENGLLIASDVAARGLDIPKVDYVVHFDVAHTAETHLHRSGRTARAFNPGHSIIMLSPSETGQFHKLLFSLKKTEKEIKDLELRNVELFEDVVILAREIESKSHVVKTASCTKNWFEKMADKADIQLDDDIIDLKKNIPTKKASMESQKKMEDLQGMIRNLDKIKSQYTSPISSNICNKNVNIDDQIATVIKFQSEDKRNVDSKSKDKNRKRKMGSENNSDPNPKNKTNLKKSKNK